MSYIAHPRWGGSRRYNEHLYLLYIRTTDQGKFDGWRLVSDIDEQTGNSRLSLVDYLDSLPKTTLVYVKSFGQVHAFLYEFVSKDHGSAIEYGNNVEFREWTTFTNDDEFNVMMDWRLIFADNKFPYLTPSQYSRKQIANTQSGCAKDLMPTTVTDLDCLYKAVHPGVLYCRDKSTVTDILGLDISSAYIYSLVFCKHACTAPIESKNPAADWELYIGALDKASIGCYKITYNCVFSVIRCFKDIDGIPLSKGKHTVEIMLSNIDLQLLMSIPQFTIESLDCELLYTFKLDYLPADIRKFCIEQYLIKQGLAKDTPERERQKKVLNSVYGNMLYDAKKILSASDPRQELYRRSKRASVCPQWGIFTMAYTKQAVIGFGIKSVGWRYSDTDSVYCSDDTANRILLRQFNQKVMSENYRLCEKLGYTDYDLDILCKLGTFELDCVCTRFRAWGYKTYAYETKSGKVVVKASGCSKKDAETNADIVFSPEFKPKKGTVTHIDYDKDYYMETQSYDYIIDAICGEI